MVEPWVVGDFFFSAGLLPMVTESQALSFEKRGRPPCL